MLLEQHQRRKHPAFGVARRIAAAAPGQVYFKRRLRPLIEPSAGGVNMASPFIMIKHIIGINCMPMNSTPSTINATLLLPPQDQASLLSQLASVPPEAEWFASLHASQTRRAYANDVRDFMAYMGISTHDQLRSVGRAHVLAWRNSLERDGLSGATVRRKLSALGSLFKFLCNADAVIANPVADVKRPAVDCHEGKTPALSRVQARKLLAAPSTDSLKGVRDRAILSVLLFGALRREEVASLTVKDFHQLRGGIPHLHVKGKGGKVRYVPLHHDTIVTIRQYLALAGHHNDRRGPLFRPIRSKTGCCDGALTADGIYACVVRKYLQQIGIVGDRLGPHALRATAATSALLNNADLGQVQAWLGHASVVTTRMYDKRSTNALKSAIRRVDY